MGICSSCLFLSRKFILLSDPVTEVRQRVPKRILEEFLPLHFFLFVFLLFFPYGWTRGILARFYGLGICICGWVSSSIRWPSGFCLLNKLFRVYWGQFSNCQRSYRLGFPRRWFEYSKVLEDCKRVGKNFCSFILYYFRRVFYAEYSAFGMEYSA